MIGADRTAFSQVSRLFAAKYARRWVARRPSDGASHEGHTVCSRRARHSPQGPQNPATAPLSCLRRSVGSRRPPARPARPAPTRMRSADICPLTVPHDLSWEAFGWPMTHRSGAPHEEKSWPPAVADIVVQDPDRLRLPVDPADRHGDFLPPNQRRPSRSVACCGWATAPVDVPPDVAASRS